MPLSGCRTDWRCVTRRNSKLFDIRRAVQNHSLLCG
jgi:hypothetical protein